MGFLKKVILITGASSGIGAAAAINFAKLGANVAIVGRNADRLNDVADQIRNAGSPEPLPIVADVTKDGSAEQIVSETIEHFGKLDVLVNNAGMVCRDNVKNLEKTKGNIVNVSSIVGLRPFTDALTYCMSKAALDQFTKCCSLDLAPKGIRVNSVNPALIRTHLFSHGGIPSEAEEALIEHERSRYPLQRVGEVSDTSSAITFLADDEASSFITGTLLAVDGGAMRI